MKDDRAEAGTKKKAPRRTAARAAKKAPAAAPRRAKAAVTSDGLTPTQPLRPRSVRTDPTCGRLEEHRHRASQGWERPVRDRQSYPWQILRMIERLSGSSGLEG